MLPDPWISIDEAAHPDGPVLLRLPEGQCCIGRWSPAQEGWFQSVDTSAPPQTRVYPTHFAPIPPLEPRVTERQRFQVGWRGEAMRSIEAADAYAAAAEFQQGATARTDGEIVVTSDDGIQSVFGYRQTIPTEHLDD